MYTQKKFLILLFITACILGLSACTNTTNQEPVPVQIAEPAPEPPAALEPEPPDISQPEPADVEIINWGGDIVDTIRADQLGYQRDSKKLAVVADVSAETFVISRAADGVVVFEGVLSEPVESPSSNETVRVADFSELIDNGEYFIVAGEGRSHPFIISVTPYPGLRAAVLEMFNYQKCGVAIDKGIWSHPECHMTDALIFGSDPKEYLEVTGGWHDAGDYGRYTGPGAKAVADLLYGYELGEVRDEELLDTVWFKVEWLFKMQDKNTGGVYHKVTTRSFPGLDLLPQDDLQEQVLSPISPTATADFAAVMALAARFYPDEAERLLTAARFAWDWLETNPDLHEFRNPRGVVTGEYGDSNSRDERVWAAAELFVTTRDEVFHDYVKQNFESINFGLGWREMGSYALVAYLFGAGDDADAALFTRMKNKLVSEALAIMDKYEQSPYGDSMSMTFPWGSSINNANNAIILMLASRFVDRPDFRDAAAAHMNYLLGFNALSRTFITGFGPTAPQNPHHRPSVAVGAAYPGMVVGGPEQNFSDPAMKRLLSEDTPPALRYVDDKDSYASNEITIYWNSPVYWLMCLLGV